MEETAGGEGVRRAREDARDGRGGGEEEAKRAQGVPGRGEGIRGGVWELCIQFDKKWGDVRTLFF